MRILVVLTLVSLAAALGPINHNLQQELDMGSPKNLVATAVAAALEDGTNDFDFESARATDPDRLSGMAGLEEDVSWPSTNSERVQRLWGIADTSATVGHLFSFTVPADAFSGEVNSYEATLEKGKALPRWLLFQSSTGQFEGVPEASDVGEVYVRVQATGAKGEAARDVFAINVVPKSSYQIPDCDAGQDRLQISVLVDAKIKNINPKRRVAAIRNLTGFLSVSPDTVKMLSQDSESAVSLHDETVVAAGAGNSKHGRTTLDPAVVLKFPSTCSTPGHSLLLERLQVLAKDGTLAEVLQLPVIGWLAQQTTPRLLTTKAPTRERRQVEGSGDYDEYDVDEEEEEEDFDDNVTPDSREIPTMASPIFPEPTATTPRLHTQHPHRHHHGQEEIEEEEAPVSPANSPAQVASIVPTPSLVPIRPTRLSDLVTPDSPESIEPSRVGVEDFMPVTPSFSPNFSPEPDYGESEESYESVEGTQSSSSNPSSPQITQPLPPFPTSSPAWGTSNEPKSSTPERERTTTEATGATVEEIEFGVKNFAPKIKHRLRKLPVVAGKVFRFTIPEDSFEDFEDGSTKKLRLIFKSAQGTALSSSSWIQFDTATQEVYGLPLEEQVSKWNFYVEAMDKEGKTATDTLEVVVQHHKATRTVNHEFTLQLKIDSKFDFPSSVDWQMNVLNGLTRFFGDSNESHITVINATASMSSSDNIFFTWTNDSLPKEECPSHTLKQMYSAMTINDKGEPSMALKEAIGKTFTIKHVHFKGLSKCESVALGPQSVGRAKETPTIGETDNNFPPTLRNHVDQLSATAGELLVYRVPEDTFYDNEDGSTRNMKLELLLMNRSPLESTNWLQFDVKNQEFFGIPEKHDKGSREYQLVCHDSTGKTATDGLVVVVQSPENRPHNVEFRMTLSKPNLSEMEKNAGNKRKLVERIAQLFGESDTSNIILDNLRQPPYQHHSGPSPTIEVLWYNKSLPADRCPEAEVSILRRMIMSDEAQGHSNPSVSSSHFSPRVSDIMRSDFNILKIMMVPTGLCQGEFTFVHEKVIPEGPPDDDLNLFGSSRASDEYLFTFIVPVVVIASMILLALLIACALYRRRRRGKLAVGETGPGTPGFRTRGIPVIFQDELDEKAMEPVAKSPVIMKEEKPPLPPPEYSVPLMGMSPHPTPPMHPHRHPTAEDPLLSDEPEASPYQPPPPFTASGRENGRQSRPKPTPTYRKPPPYVPP